MLPAVVVDRPAEGPMAPLPPRPIVPRPAVRKWRSPSHGNHTSGVMAARTGAHDECLPDFERLRTLIDELANTLQIVVLTAQDLEPALSATAQQASVITRGLRRVTAAWQALHSEGGSR
jgi:hypothetical protein